MHLGTPSFYSETTNCCNKLPCVHASSSIVILLTNVSNQFSYKPPPSEIDQKTSSLYYFPGSSLGESTISSRRDKEERVTNKFWKCDVKFRTSPESKKIDQLSHVVVTYLMYENYVGDGTGHILHVFLGKNPGKSTSRLTGFSMVDFCQQLTATRTSRKIFILRLVAGIFLLFLPIISFTIGILFRCYNAASFVQWFVS